ncbi:MAG: DUF192 domain-containing protein [Candidatus Sungbacteria bacterium]|nr:DUF192 domain-containing protein [Candidatus Sungbacteria bacterium]
MNLNFRGFLWLVSGLTIFILVGVAILTFQVVSNNSVSKEVVVEIGGSKISATLAESLGEREKGLAGRTFLGEYEGMLFRTEKPEPQVFWMRGMLIPIDIIWIRDGVVIGTETNALPPLAASVDAALLRYSSPIAVDQVLEVPAGFVERHKILTGDKVKIKTPE